MAGRWNEAKDAVDEAASRLGDPAGKEYQDLQILRGDLIVQHDPHLAESLYSEVIQQGDHDDARYSEIRARAFYARGLSLVSQRRRSQGRRDFDTAADIWTNLQDPAAGLAEWQSLTCEDRLPIDPHLLETEPPAVRVRVIRNHRERLDNVGSRAARRKAPVERSYGSCQ